MTPAKYCEKGAIVVHALLKSIRLVELIEPGNHSSMCPVYRMVSNGHSQPAFSMGLSGNIDMLTVSCAGLHRGPACYILHNATKTRTSLFCLGNKSVRAAPVA